MAGRIEVATPRAADCSMGALPPEGNVKLRGYRVLSEVVRAYSPTGDVRGPLGDGRLVPRYELASALSPPRARILDLLCPEDPARDTIEAIVRPAPRPRHRRALARPLDDDARRFLERALASPSPQGPSAPPTPERASRPAHESPRPVQPADAAIAPTSNAEWSLADELREAERHQTTGDLHVDLLQEIRLYEGTGRESVEREWLGKLALSVEEDGEDAKGEEESRLAGAAQRLDALLAESRALHLELAGIQRDLQMACSRAGRCAAAARRLGREARALHYLDDVVSLLRGDVASARAARTWPFALGARAPGRNYIV